MAHSERPPAVFQPRLRLRTLGRGDGLLGMRPHGALGPRGGSVTVAEVDWTYRLADGSLRQMPAPQSVLGGRTAAGMPRDRRAEADASDALQATGLRPLPADRLQWRAPGLAPSLGPLWTLPQESQFGDFWAERVPLLQAQGWSIVVEPGFAHESAPVERWRLLLAPDGGEAAGREVLALAPRQRPVQKLRLPEREGAWLLSLGVEIDGELLDLAPMLADLLQREPRWLDAARIAAIDDASTIGLRAPGGRHIEAPAAPLKAIVGAMVDLLMDPARRQRREGEPLRLGGWEARRLAALRDGLDQARRAAGMGRQAGWLLEGDAGLALLKDRLATAGVPPPVEAPAGLAVPLRDYQRDGLAWLQYLRAQGLAGILADDMGLGKTAQALAHVLAEKEADRLDRPALVVVPTSLVFNWQAEAARMAPGLRVLAFTGAERAAALPDITRHDLVLTTYALVWRDIRRLTAAPGFHLLILDEAQMARNAATQGARALRRIPARHRLCLTGTPLENHLGELWAQFDFLLPGYLGDAATFARRFRKPIEENGETLRAQLLADRVRPFILRRRREDVVRELPGRTEALQRLPLDGAQRELYEAVRAAADQQVRRLLARQGLKEAIISVLDALLKLRQVCCDPRLVRGAPPSAAAAATVGGSAKLRWLADHVPTMVEEGRRLLVFSQFTGLLDLVARQLQRQGLDFLLLTGATATAARGDVVRRFQAGEAPILLASLKAGGTGLNLTAADTVVHLDPWWNPAVQEQATARAHRIGQTRPVTVYRLVIEGSIEERMLELQARKDALARGVLGVDAAGAAKFTEADLDALLAPLAEPQRNPRAIPADDDPRWGSTGRRRG
ncbi:DEAD/DEAH box helicase [Xylophilus sp.]|uniref:DEAD/DEAH box helicase n=1 Tax=Xylophilus sp. TaxID=2653893 RepID=UPI0013BCBC9E|nr:DEAD/DEAH box helicase [Xylophilus sp.]KAF1047301.1 MAG: RNA polymerase-associated protein RapA [Xylophilus sp.]